MSILSRVATLTATVILAACYSSERSPKTTLPPQPPMWVVSDADSEITLYPTLHILPPEIEWKSGALAKRLEGADEVWFEIMPGAENDPALQQTMMLLGIDPGKSLLARLSADEKQGLSEAVGVMGMTLESVDNMRPWLVSTLVGVSALISKGFEPNAGVEKQLQPMVKGKTIRALETADAQMKMLASIPEEAQMNMLRQTLQDLDESVADLKDMAHDWAVGDLEELEDDLIAEMKTDMPVVYELLFKARNENWVQQIETEMKGSGTDFIAVGAGHLVGDDGVPALLKARGYTVTRF